MRAIGIALFLFPSSALFFFACSSSNGTTPSSNDAGSEASTYDSALPTPNADSSTPSKPPPRAKDGGAPDATLPPPPKTKPDGGPAYDAGQLMDADVDAAPPDTTVFTPLDPSDESQMPDHGIIEDTCANLSMSKDTGFCKTDFFGADFVEGCAGSSGLLVYLLDCARYETPGSTRARCQDDAITVGCYVHDVSPVGAFELGDTQEAIDLTHKCPADWEGTGYCNGDFLFMCSGGKDYALDCGTFNFGSFTYTCDATSGTVQCK
jgi:hypothetical protein